VRAPVPRAGPAPTLGFSGSSSPPSASPATPFPPAPLARPLATPPPPPAAHGRIVAAGGEQRGARRERDAADAALVPAEGVDVQRLLDLGAPSPRLEAPQPRGVGPPTRPVRLRRRHHAPHEWIERHARRRALVPLDLARKHPVALTPHAQRLVRGGAEEPLGFCVERKIEHRAPVPLEHRDAGAVACAPHAERTVLRGARDEVSVRVVRHLPVGQRRSGWALAARAGGVVGWGGVRGADRCHGGLVPGEVSQLLGLADPPHPHRRIVGAGA